jgi:hypothetical protein
VRNLPAIPMSNHVISDHNMAIRAMVLLMTIAVALGGRRGGFISGTGTLTLTSGGNRAGNDEELGDSISLDTLDDAQDLSNTKAKQVHTIDAMCIQSTDSISFPPDKVVGGKSCCGQTGNDPCPAPDDKQTSHCRDDLSDAAYWVPHSGGRCLKFSKRSAYKGQTYIEFHTDPSGKDVTITTVGRLSTPEYAGQNVGVLGLKRVKCTTDPSIPEDMGKCTIFKSAVCLDCSSVVGPSEKIFSSEKERKNQIEDIESMYDKCATKAFEDGVVKPAFILENNSGNNGVNDDALKRCLAWIQIF